VSDGGESAPGEVADRLLGLAADPDQERAEEKPEHGGGEEPDQQAPVDESATVDDAEVSALLLDEQSADSATIGRTAGRPGE